LGTESRTDVVALGDALRSLEVLEPSKSQVMERPISGTHSGRNPEVLKVSVETVIHDWKLAKAWLMRELGRGDAL
jgi:ECF sigma factor